MWSARSSAPILLERIRLPGSSQPPASLSVSALQDAIFADLRPQLTVVLWLAVMVFSLAGINVVISTIAQAAEQTRGTAIRLAVGASYARLLGETLQQHGLTLCLAAALGLPWPDRSSSGSDRSCRTGGSRASRVSCPRCGLIGTRSRG